MVLVSKYACTVYCYNTLKAEGVSWGKGGLP